MDSYLRKELEKSGRIVISVPPIFNMKSWGELLEYYYPMEYTYHPKESRYACRDYDVPSFADPLTGCDVFGHNYCGYNWSNN